MQVGDPQGQQLQGWALQGQQLLTQAHDVMYSLPRFVSVVLLTAIMLKPADL